MPVETRFFRSDQHTINGLTAYALLTANTTSAIYVQEYYRVLIGIRVWKRSVDGTEIEITDGTVAVAEPPAGGEGYLSASWDCPEISLESSDAIVVRVYLSHFVPGAWLEWAAFITDELGATQLNASTWTVWYYLYCVLDSKTGVYISRFYFGDADHNSRIENFSYEAAAPPPPAAGYQYSNGLVTVQVIQ